MSKTSEVSLDRCIRSIRAGKSLNGEARAPRAGEVGILTLAAVSGDSFDSDACKAVPASTTEQLGPSVRGDTLLMSRSNTIELVGSAVFVEEDRPDRYLPDLIWELELRDDSPLLPRFLADFLATSAGRRLLQSAAMGTSGSMKKLSMKRLRALKVPRVPSAIQEEWERTVPRFNRLNGTLSDLLKAKRDLRRGLMQELLTGKKRFPEFRAQAPWTTVRLGDVLEERTRPVDWDDEEQYHLVSIRRGNGGLFFRESKQGSEIKTKNLQTIEAGDFLISKMQVVHGALAVVPPEFGGFHVSSMYMILRPRAPQRIRSEFLHYLAHLPTMYRAVFLSCHGVHIEKMTFVPERFLDSTIRIPPALSEQDRILEVLRLVDKEMADLEAERQQLALLKSGVLQQLLSGKVELPDHFADSELTNA